VAWATVNDVSDNRTPGQRFVDWLGRRSLVAILLFASVVLSSLIVLVKFGLDVKNWVDERGRDEKAVEYKKLETLHAGFTLAKFEEQLGPPIFQERDLEAKVTESTFQRSGYWVQTISGRGGTVLFFSITSCDIAFAPTFKFAGGSVTLNKSTFASVGSGPLGSVESKYFLSGATANSNFLDIAFGGNPGNYQTFVWGLDDACISWLRLYENLFTAKLLPFPNNRFDFRGPPARGGVAVLRFRHRAVVNTYGEAAPGVQLSELGRFQLGVDRIKVRTVSNWTEFGRGPPRLASVGRPHYFLAPTARCLRRVGPHGFVEAFYTPPQEGAGVDVHPSLIYAIEGSLGAHGLTASRPSHAVTLSFESSVSQAQRMKRTTPTSGYFGRFVISRFGNVVVAWQTRPPNAAEQSLMNRCLQDVLE